MRNKKLNRKGFTLVELLAVIVVLAIILVITVPMILNTLGNTSSSAFQSSAQSAANFYREQLQLKALGNGSGEADFLKDVTFDANGKAKLNARCIRTAEADILGLDSATYEYNDTDVDGCSTVAITDNKVTVTLKAKSKGKFDGVKTTSSDTAGTAIATK